MPWRKHALELAAQIRAKDLSAHSLNVSAEIASRWRHDTVRCPGTGKLLRAIREWEEKGKLAPAKLLPAPRVNPQKHQKVRKRKKMSFEVAALKTCANAAYVSEKFELCRRWDNPTFSHHAEVAALPAAEAGRPA